jgi:hypothetical protein
MMHCVRLLDMAIEIANTGEIIVRRPKEHINILMSIRRGEMEFDNLLEMAEEKIKLLDIAYDNSSLIDEVNRETMDELLIKIRKQKYK